MTDQERASYTDIAFDVEEYRGFIGAPALIHKEDKAKTLMARWRFPSLSLHGIEGAFAEPGSKTVIPRKIIGEISFFFLKIIFRFPCLKC